MIDSNLLSGDLLLACSAYAIATASPGPSNLAIMAIAMRSGRRAALQFALGVVSGSLFWGLLAAFGLSAVLATWSHALVALKLAGGVYLLWLAIRSARSSLARDQPDDCGGELKGRSFELYLRGAGMHLTNPKAVLAWVSIVALALPTTPGVATALSVVMACTCLGLLVFGGYALAFSTPPAVRIYRSSRRFLEGTLALVFGYAGLRLIASR